MFYYAVGITAVISYRKLNYLFQFCLVRNQAFGNSEMHYYKLQKQV